MPMIQIRHVPPSVHRALKARAARAGMTLSDYLLREMERVAVRPTLEDLADRIERRRGSEPSLSGLDTAELVRDERDSR